MKTKQKKELHAKTIQEIKVLLKEAKEEMFSLKLEKVQRKLKNLRSIFEKRKNIAKMLTILREKEIEGAILAEKGKK
ncbi:50S ribosomal protein L29 [Candidatus Microgenomates bacterium]|nr:MAG: 50S ribosomal protein L29 [Candidatus Microgenomates bacterium]